MQHVEPGFQPYEMRFDWLLVRLFCTATRGGAHPGSMTTARRRSFVGDLVGISPTLALYAAFIIVPTVPLLAFFS